MFALTLRNEPLLPPEGSSGWAFLALKGVEGTCRNLTKFIPAIDTSLVELDICTGNRLDSANSITLADIDNLIILHVLDLLTIGEGIIIGPYRRFSAAFKHLGFVDFKEVGPNLWMEFRPCDREPKSKAVNRGGGEEFEVFWISLFTVETHTHFVVIGVRIEGTDLELVRIIILPRFIEVFLR